MNRLYFITCFFVLASNLSGFCMSPDTSNSELLVKERFIQNYGIVLHASGAHDSSGKRIGVWTFEEFTDIDAQFHIEYFPNGDILFFPNQEDGDGTILIQKNLSVHLFMNYVVNAGQNTYWAEKTCCDCYIGYNYIPREKKVTKKKYCTLIEVVNFLLFKNAPINKKLFLFLLKDTEIGQMGKELVE